MAGDVLLEIATYITRHLRKTYVSRMQFYDIYANVDRIMRRFEYHSEDYVRGVLRIIHHGMLITVQKIFLGNSRDTAHQFPYPTRNITKKHLFFILFELWTPHARPVTTSWKNRLATHKMPAVMQHAGTTLRNPRFFFTETV